MFELEGQEFMALNGGPQFRFSEAISLFVKLGWLEVQGRSNYHILDRDAMEDRATL